MSDIISYLPDDILCHILSFLPTKYSVRSRMLSTRWKYLFAFVPVLDFDFDRDTNAPTSYDETLHESFTDFVNKVFIMHNSPQITRLRLVNIFLRHPTDFDSWISSAICRNVQELDISVGFFDTKTLPCIIFSSQSLSVLKVNGNFDVKIPSCAFLPSLKTLHLIAANFDHSNCTNFSFCPALEDLCFERCNFRNVEVLDINAPSLRKLRIDRSYCNELMLNATSLVYFEYLGDVFEKARTETGLTSLVKADIGFQPYSYSNVIRELVSIVSHARHLYLSMSAIEAFQFFIKELPTFHRLARLEIGDVSCTVFDLLPEILNRCSLLEVLVFQEGFCFESADDDSDSDSDSDGELSYICMSSFENIPSCVSMHLKEIEFRAFTMQEAEWKLVEYFRKTAQVLTTMKIQTILGRERQMEFTEKLSTFSKLSKDCQVEVMVDWDDENETQSDETQDSDDETEDLSDESE